MSEQQPERLCDHAKAIAEILPLMERMYKPANLSDPTRMMHEDARLKLAADAGKHLVVEDFRAALVQAGKEVGKARHRTEVV